MKLFETSTLEVTLRKCNFKRNYTSAQTFTKLKLQKKHFKT